MKRSAWALGIALTALIPVSQMHAQRYFPSPEIGIRGGYDTKVKEGLAGAYFMMPLDGRLELLFGADFLPSEGLDSYRVNGDALFRIGDWGSLFAGVGIALVQEPSSREPGTLGGTSSISELGYNLFVGYEFFRSADNGFRPLIDARYVSGGEHNAFRFSVGLGYALELGGYGTHQAIPPARRPFSP